ncbi:MAG: energy transducer TonB [Bacteroidota bacterium]
MKRIILIGLFIFTAYSIKAQSSDPQNMKIETQKEAFYPGGDSLLFATLHNTIKYTEAAISNQIKTQIFVSFDVLENGTLAEINILNNPGYGIGESVKTALSGLKFTPSILADGSAIKSNLMLTIPIKTF